MGREVSVVESYDPVTKEWCRLSDMLTPRAHPGVCVSDDMIYVFGGMNEDEGPLRSVEKYDIFQVSIVQFYYYLARLMPF